MRLSRAYSGLYSVVYNSVEYKGPHSFFVLERETGSVHINVMNTFPPLTDVYGDE